MCYKSKYFSTPALHFIATCFDYLSFIIGLPLVHIFINVIFFLLQGFPQLPEANIVNTSHRAALQHANATSCGYFVSQDSSFGNQILPVLPRFDSK